MKAYLSTHRLIQVSVLIREAFLCNGQKLIQRCITAQSTETERLQSVSHSRVISITALHPQPRNFTEEDQQNGKSQRLGRSGAKQGLLDMAVVLVSL